MGQQQKTASWWFWTSHIGNWSSCRWIICFAESCSYFVSYSDQRNTSYYVIIFIYLKLLIIFFCVFCCCYYFSILQLCRHWDSYFPFASSSSPPIPQSPCSIATVFQQQSQVHILWLRVTWRKSMHIFYGDERYMETGILGSEDMHLHSQIKKRLPIKLLNTPWQFDSRFFYQCLHRSCHKITENNWNSPCGN